MGIKGILTDLNHSISHNFMYSQSRFSDVTYDTLQSYKLLSTFEATTGKLETHDLSFDENKVTNKARAKKNLSKSYTTNDVCPELQQIIMDHRQKIEAYLGTGFLFEEPLYFKNFHYPDEMEGYDIYSNVWHQDSHDGNRLLKIFVNLMDVQEQDGPFCYLTEKNTRLNWKKMGRRWTFNNIGNIFDPPETQRAVGDAGSYLLIDTSRCLHRASNPVEFRDMLNITLYPKWRVRHGRKKYEY
jgi:hypothetical protein